MTTQLLKGLCRLALISVLVATCPTIPAQSLTKSEILTSFYETPEYQSYLVRKPITLQVIVSIEVIELGEIIDFPNPYVAGLFKAYLEEHTSLSFKTVVNTITMPPKIERDE
ncbi:MAG: hypothetical protein O3A15_05040 [Proteobacteria bacterium]|nr:hypothetical protein [Pseudomonadota bacterium]